MTKPIEKLKTKLLNLHSFSGFAFLRHIVKCQHHARSDGNQHVFIVVIQQLLDAGFGSKLALQLTCLIHVVHTSCSGTVAQRLLWQRTIRRKTL